MVPIKVAIKENSTLNYKVKAIGEGDLTYSLVETADSNGFSIDPSTGQLSTKITFDYETPRDADNDGVYLIKVKAKDVKQRDAVAVLNIHIENVAEYEATIEFPINESNTGGRLTQFDIRGYVTLDGLPVNSLGDNKKVFVNNSQAVFDAKNEGRWIANIPLAEGENKLQVEIREDDSILYANYTGILHNSEIVQAKSVIVREGDTSYGITLSRRGIIESTTSDPMGKSLVDLDSSSSIETPCANFYGLHIRNDGKKILATCLQDNPEKFALMEIDLSNNSQRSYALDSELSSNLIKFDWIGDEHLLFSQNQESLAILNLADGSIHNFKLACKSDKICAIRVPQYFVRGTKVYVGISESDKYTLGVFDVLDVANNKLDTVDVANVIGYEIPGLLQINTFASRSVSAGDFEYFIVTQNLIELNMNDGTSRSYTLNVTDEFNTNYSLHLFFADENGLLYAKDPFTSEIFTVNKTTLSVKLLDSRLAPSNIIGGHDFSISPDNAQLFIYNFLPNKTIRASLKDHSLLEYKYIGKNLLADAQSHSQISYDWGMQKMIRSRFFNWIGPNLPKNEILLSSYDFNTEVETSLIRVDQLETYLQRENANYRILNVSITDIRDVIWFSSMSTVSPTNALEGIYAYNMTTGDIETLSSTLHSTDREIEPYLSPYSSSLGGVVLTAEKAGYMKVLRKDKSIETILPRGANTDSTYNAKVDEKRGLIYVARSEGKALDLRLDEYNIKTGELTTISSKQGDYLKRFDINTDSRIIYSAVQGRLFAIDIYTGNGVYIELEYLSI